jgi:hypothetical protein
MTIRQRDPEPVRLLACTAQRLSERIGGENRTGAGGNPGLGFPLNGDLLTYDHPGNTDIIDVAERRREGLANPGGLLSGRCDGLKAQGVDFRPFPAAGRYGGRADGAGPRSARVVMPSN